MEMIVSSVNAPDGITTEAPRGSVTVPHQIINNKLVYYLL